MKLAYSDLGKTQWAVDDVINSLGLPEINWDGIKDELVYEEKPVVHECSEDDVDDQSVCEKIKCKKAHEN